MRQYSSSVLTILLAACVFLASASPLAPGGTSIPLAFFQKKKEYTPLLFFKAPKGMVPECDFVERMVSQVEKELGVKVERFDVMRDRNARLLFDRLDVQSKQQLPLLYNRESRQCVFGMTDKNRVRAWAKGRWLSADYKPTLPAEFYSIEKEDAEGLGDDEEVMMEDEDLTPLQKKGKNAMRDRLESDAKSKRKV
mmetsp:Transcript_5134/g.10876  ORF Transcript_5134/g.10876 Transcript_5134/m.10876 type:complete len:195 (-) Transcript_5134:135-719(-)